MPPLALRHQKPWTPHPDRDLRLASAIHLGSWTLANSESLYPAHYKELLNLTVWKATELDGKWATRFRSEGVMHGSPGEVKINHEHVVTRKWVVAAMIDNPDRVAEILAASVGCMLTTEEHGRLGSGWGWDRYVSGGVNVIDAKTGHSMDFKTAQSQLLTAMSIEPPDFGSDFHAPDATFAPLLKLQGMQRG